MHVKFVLTVVLLGTNVVLCQNLNINSSPIDQTNSQTAQESLDLPHNQVDFPPVAANGHRAASWSKGQMVGFSIGEMKEPLSLYDRNGSILFTNALAFESAMRIYTQDATATSQGTAVVAASATTADGATADVIVEVGKEGTRRVIRTSPFYPLRVCVTNEGTVWAFGKELSQERTSELRSDYAMLREYSFEKGMLRSAVDRVTFRPPQGVPVSGEKGDVYLRCGSQKVVLISGPTRELMEYDLASSKLTRFPLPALPQDTYVSGAALTDSGEVYISTIRPGQGALTGLLHLRVTSQGTVEGITLTLAPPKGNNWLILLGSDGEDLVYARGRSSPSVYWSRATQKGVKK